jgi:ATP-dependent Clp protease, protease subunit
MARLKPNTQFTRRNALAASVAAAAVANGLFAKEARAQTVAQVTYVIFQAGINTQSTTQLMSRITQIQSPEIYLVMSTPGGEVVAGITTYNFLRALPKKITTHNIGSVDSIGATIFLAGERRFANGHSTFLLHGPARSYTQNTSLNLHQLREQLNAVETDETRIAAIIKERTGLTTDQIAKYFEEGRTEDAPGALRVGIIQQVLELSIPAGAPTIVV